MSIDRHDDHRAMFEYYAEQAGGTSPEELLVTVEATQSEMQRILCQQFSA